MNYSRKQPGVAFWATVVVVAALVAYPLSFGPAVFVLNDCDAPPWAFYAFSWIYYPILWLDGHGPQVVRDVIEWYWRLCG